MSNLKTPDITLAQIVSAVFAALPSVLVLLGVNIDHDQTVALENLRDLALALLGADAVIRVGRAVGRRPRNRAAADGEADIAAARADHA